MSKRAVGISTALLTYFQENPNKVITVDQLLKAFPDFDRNQIHSNVYALRKKPHGKDIELLQTGTWRYVETATKVTVRETLTLEVLKETDEMAIAMDESGNVYKLTLLG